MPEQVLVSDHHLAAFYAAVKSVNRALAARIEKATSEKPIISAREVLPGQTAGDKYALNISITDAKSVLDCLVNLEKVHGYNSKFSGYQINTLVMLWRMFLKHLESSSTPKLPNAE